MNETIDTASVARAFERAGIGARLTRRVADGVLVSGVAAVAALGAGAFPSWAASRIASSVVATAFDEGLTCRQVADRLAVIADAQATALSAQPAA